MYFVCFSLQCVNLMLFVLQIYYHFISNIWIIFAVILYEGLLGGAAYVNSFYQISKKVNSSLATFFHFRSFEKITPLLIVALTQHQLNQKSYTMMGYREHRDDRLFSTQKQPFVNERLCRLLHPVLCPHHN